MRKLEYTFKTDTLFKMLFVPFQGGHGRGIYPHKNHAKSGYLV